MSKYCLAFKISNKYKFIVFGLTRPGLKPMIYRTWGEPLTITPPMQFLWMDVNKQMYGWMKDIE